MVQQKMIKIAVASGEVQEVVLNPQIRAGSPI
jgi:hypothetical protein